MRMLNHVLSRGTGVPVVLVHAFPVDHHMWDECAAEIVRQAEEEGLARPTIWAPDMPGAGSGPIPSVEESGGAADDGSYPRALDRMADAYVDMLRAAGYDRAIWVGLSMGGYLVLDVQRLHPDAVAGLALCDTKADADGPEAHASRLRIADEMEATGTREPVMHFAAANPMRDSTVKRSHEFIARMTGLIEAQDPKGVAWRERMAAGRPDLNDQLPLVTAPAAVVCGDKDPSSPPAVMRPIAEAMTGTSAAFTVIDDCGHFSAMEHPDELARPLVALIARVNTIEAMKEGGR
ncbi:alpha/beta fold hydrolase [Bifidobacterium avesanii]|uniref:Alpha/beta fold hydrolase n=1 Tax=Bifidobacterium avesanii TaxID=1798157 RepID=A0A7K3THP0_9BIFI|nr:alpha/beta hydrolase [Bifidobacterium avesanii]KAB8292600.1 alpha/beta hydrolase [Bifidobacterium avesanii]NEG78572.1 alpha/beta fold hydrolase [Bifidobacterium avesanii]